MDLFLLTTFILASFLAYWWLKGFINYEIMRLLPPVLLPVILVLSNIVENIPLFLK